MSADENIKQIYDTNPITTVHANDLIYLGVSPYGIGNDGAALFSNFELSITQTGSLTVNGTLLVTSTISAANLSGTNTGDQTITLTGNVTGSGIGSFAATIANSAVTYAKIQNISTTNRLLGRSTAGPGVVEEITVGTGLLLSGGVLSTTSAGDVTGIIGTASQVLANGTSGSSQDGEVTLTLPQNIAIGSIPQFAAINLVGTFSGSGISVASGGANSNAGGVFSSFSGIIGVNSELNVVGVDFTNTFSSSTSNLTISQIRIIPAFAINASTTGTARALWIRSGSRSGAGNLLTGISFEVEKPSYGDSTQITARIGGRTQIGTSQQFDISDAGIVTAGTWQGTPIATSYIANSAVTYAKIQDVSTNNRLLGRSTTGAGVVEEITVGTGLTLSGGTLSTTSAGDVTGIIGTANQVLANGTSGSSQDGEVTLTLPQNIDTNAVPLFGGLLISNTLTVDPNGSSSMIFISGANPFSISNGSTVSTLHLNSQKFISDAGLYQPSSNPTSGIVSYDSMPFISIPNGVTANIVAGFRVSPTFTAAPATGIITDYIGFYFGGGTAAANTTITTSTGILCEEPVAGTTKYAGQFKGKVNFGTTGQSHFDRLGNLDISSIFSVSTTTFATVMVNTTNPVIMTNGSALTTAYSSSQTFIWDAGIYVPATNINFIISFHSNAIINIPNGITVASVVGFKSSPYFTGSPATGIITNYIGFHFDGGTAAANTTITTSTGILCEEPVAGTTKYAAQFKGKVNFGTTGQSNFDRLGVLNVTANINQNGSSNTVIFEASQIQFSALNNSFTGGFIIASNTGTLSCVTIGSGLTLSGGSISVSASGVTHLVTGTANQVLVNGTSGSGQSGNITLTTPQDIGTASTPTFNDIILTTGIIPMSSGGTGAALTPSNGGIVYTSTLNMSVLIATATARQVVLSGANTQPAWSTATYPATTTANNLLYSSSSNVIANLATANNGVLVTSNSGVPSISSTIPAVEIDVSSSSTSIAGGTPQVLTFKNTSNTNNNWIQNYYFGQSGTLAGSIGMQITDQTNAYGDCVIGTRSAATGFTEKMRISSTGLVGIGVSAPLFELDIRNASATTCNMSIGKWTGSPPTAYGTPYLKIGGSELGTNGLFTIGFGLQSALVDKPAVEIGALMTTSTGARGIFEFVIATSSVNSLSSAAVERFRITNDGFMQLASPSFTANATTATVITSLGPAGASTTIQEWLTIKNASGTTRYIACF